MQHQTGGNGFNWGQTYCSHYSCVTSQYELNYWLIQKYWLHQETILHQRPSAGRLVSHLVRYLLIFDRENIEDSVTSVQPPAVLFGIKTRICSLQPCKHAQHTASAEAWFHQAEQRIFWWLVRLLAVAVPCIYYWWCDWHGQWGLGLEMAVESIGVRESCVPFIRQASGMPRWPHNDPSNTITKHRPGAGYWCPSLTWAAAQSYGLTH